ncbi:ABC transporter ATP-binding protein [Salinisphaera hydrothermalis]|uniref:ABC transporter ATP-binding protein n=1 Tax=Salinisphaera hydrothermalis (strain C41B8) TaxID=1304275 RepID=A0A084IKM2_SALHC|nr:ABC transporter ATP-binding protein [Salinisphaera hydrothermalis]KEZ77256.1 ABC transporter ATP-binding protein [Salinisphaera hydrothermalis C41B8]
MSKTATVDRDPPVVRVRGLRKSYPGTENAVLDGIDWDIPRGRVIGLLGRNGAGKTTLMRCLLGLLPVDEGEIEIFGEPMDEPRGERLHRIGFVPQTFDLFKWMRVGSYLNFTAAFYRHWNRTLENRLVDNWGLDRRAKIGKLSEGQRQKLAIIRAMAPEPDLLVLDEPVASLDPQTRAAFMNELIDVVRHYGKTVILSTHITADLERAEADIALLDGGRLVLEMPLAELRERIRKVELTRACGWSEPPEVAGALSSEVAGTRLTLIVDQVGDAQLGAIAKQYEAELSVERITLEDAFVALA